MSRVARFLTVGKHRQWRPAVAGVLAVAIGGGIAGCGSSSSSSPAAASSGSGGAKQYKLSMLLSTAGFYSLPIWLMQNEGFAQRYHLTLTSAQFQTGSGSLSTVYDSGTGDVAGGGMDLPVLLHDKYKLPVTVIGAMFTTNNWVLVSKAGSQYKTLASLKGQTVGITGAGAWSNYLINDEAFKEGFKPSDFKITPLGATATEMSALASGNAAAVFSQAPQYQQALGQHQIQVVHSWIGPQAPALVFTARTKQVNAQPGAYAAFMKAYRASVAAMEKNRSWAAKMAVKSGLAGTTSTAGLQDELTQYLGAPGHPCTGVWSCTGAFSRQMYNSGRSLLVGSGFYKTTGFPSYASLVAGAPPVS